MLDANGGETWYMTENNVIRWASAYGLGSSCELRYAADGTNFNYTITDALVGYPNTQGTDTNTNRFARFNLPSETTTNVDILLKEDSC